MEKREPSYTVGGNINWCSHNEKQYRDSFMSGENSNSKTYMHPSVHCGTVIKQPRQKLYIYIGEGNGTPLQYSCLENPMDGGAWQAAVHGVAEGPT